MAITYGDIGILISEIFFACYLDSVLLSFNECPMYHGGDSLIGLQA